MKFTKMHGAGNDYIFIDCFRNQRPERVPQLAQLISDRHFGVGSDGLVLICPADNADAEMMMYNVDGTYSEMCGNAIRCVAKYLFEHKIVSKDEMFIQSANQVLRLKLIVINNKVDRVQVDMGEPILESGKIPTTLLGNPVCDVPLPLKDRELVVNCVSMGNPHCIAFVDEITDELVLGAGPQIENNSHFPNRTNVEFVEVINSDELRQRTWERGSGETLACGTGASAVCVAGVITGRCERSVIIHLLGGDLEIEWSEIDNHVYKTGPAIEVFSGEWPNK